MKWFRWRSDNISVTRHLMVSRTTLTFAMVVRLFLSPINSTKGTIKMDIEDAPKAKDDAGFVALVDG